MRAILGLDGYFASDTGVVYGPKGVPLKAQEEHDGRLRISIRRKRYLIHKLVMLAYEGPCPEGYQVNHKDGNCKNNHLENLEYVTPQANIDHAVRYGLFRNSRKVTDTEVAEIRSLLAKGLKGKDIAEMYGVTPSWVSAIKRGKGRSYTYEPTKQTA